MDAASAPNLFHAGGHTIIGGLQKAGVYHAADATTMAPLWHTIVGGPCFVCNAASTAVSSNRSRLLRFMNARSITSRKPTRSATDSRFIVAGDMAGAVLVWSFGV